MSRVRRVLRGVALVVGVLSLLVGGLLFTACVVDDLRIDQDMGSAVATVTDASSLDADVEFDTGTGRHVRAQTGVLYPTGLAEGQRVRVEYRRANPDLVRVSGRSWTLAAWPSLSVPLIAVPLCALVYHFATPRVRTTVRRRSPTGDAGAPQ